MGPQYPDGTTNVFSYIEPRGGMYDVALFYGLQGYIKEYMLRKTTKEDVDFAEAFWTIHGEPFDRRPWDLVVNDYNGYLPLVIRAVKEGTIVPVKNILVSAELTEEAEAKHGKELRVLVTWTETSLLRAVWYGTTAATQSWHIKQVIKKYLEETGDVANLPFKLHDFGSRGVSSFESNCIASGGHLINFMGSDSPQGIMFLNAHYNAPLESVGFSIPASEHSTITSWTRKGELLAYENMITKFAKPGKIFAVVSDSYNIFEAVKMWVRLRDRILASGATLVIRPDSGDPAAIIPAILSILEHGFTDKDTGEVWPGYPCTKNEKGYKVLQQVRVIWGDGINQLSIETILRTCCGVHGWSADMIAFGMGGALLQGFNRDTMKWAMKCSSAKIDGKWVDVFKDPITDSGKVSKKGRLALYKALDGTFYTGVEDWMPNQLEVVYDNGKLMRDQSLTEIRALADQG
jgi:nicotinamide phosphoribosyltransferase